MDSWMLGVTVPFGKHAIQASYTQSSMDVGGGLDGKAKQWALGYTYEISKRTGIYAAYADMNNDSDRKAIGAASLGDSSNAGQGYQQGFQIGLKHSF
jgi:predicted porin